MGFRVLGVDPGLTRCGFGLVTRDTDRALRYGVSGVIRSANTEPLDDRLFTVGSQLTEVFDAYLPDVIALERVFSQQNLHTVMSVAQISGIVLFEARKRNIPIALYTPTQVKAAVTGYGKAPKKQIAAMVTKILNIPDFHGPADESDALALAISHHLHNPLLAADRKAATTTLTPAQEKWLAAERQSRTK